jgi:2'-5' RNA ligase
MRLSAAIVVPPELLVDVSRVVRSATVTAPVEPRRRFGRRLPTGGAHVAGRPPTVVTATRELETPSLAAMFLPLSGFGNVTLADAATLAAALRAEAATWERPTLVLAGGTALEFPGDDAVWVRLEGDLERLETIGRGVPMTVQRLGFFVDRRQFRPWLAVGRITGETTAPYLERLVAALDAHRSDPWTVTHISIIRRPNEADSEDDFEIVDRIPLARA